MVAQELVLCGTLETMFTLLEMAGKTLDHDGSENLGSSCRAKVSDLKRHPELECETKSQTKYLATK